ncbi:MAG: hypothetical protein K0S25_1690 [Bacillus sp. (in: firmicutes)]|nr:hypothetical protein [Bacillus sp. (in: firmicutes)]
MRHRQKISQYTHLTDEQLNTANWSVIELTNLNENDRLIFLQRKKGIDLYFNTLVSVPEIEKQAGMKKKDLYIFIDRCLTLDEYGNIFGYRALIPYKNIKTYTREQLPSDKMDFPQTKWKRLPEHLHCYLLNTPK